MPRVASVSAYFDAMLLPQSYKNALLIGHLACVDVKQHESKKGGAADIRQAWPPAVRGQLRGDKLSIPSVE